MILQIKLIKNRRDLAITVICILAVALLVSCSTARLGENQKPTFANPLLPVGADPWSIYKDGFYYYTQTVGDRIQIWKTKNI